MSACWLERLGLERLLSGSLSKDEQQRLAEHLEIDCVACDRILDASGLDLDALSALLGAPDAEVQGAETEATLWQKIEGDLEKKATTTGPARDRDEASAPRGTKGPGLAKVLPILRRAKVDGAQRESMPRRTIALVAASIAAVGLFTLLSRPEEAARDTDGIKGAAPAPRATLFVEAPKARCLPNGTTLGLSFALERPAWLTLLHQREGGDFESLFASERVQNASAKSDFTLEGGKLAYALANEPGIHVFVLAASDARVDASELAEKLQAGLAKSSDALVLGDASIGLHVVEICAEPEPDPVGDTP